MTDQEIYKKAILKAEKNGYKEHLEMLPVMPLCKTGAELLKDKILWQRRYEIIFSHDFAKAFWGFEEIDDSEGEFATITAWKYHLQQMILEKESLKYLEKYL